jgi:hypothetical protein
MNLERHVASNAFRTQPVTGDDKSHNNYYRFIKMEMVQLQKERFL